MKKGLVLFLIFTYALVSSGAIISFHYCGGHLQYLSLGIDKEDKGCCGEKKKLKKHNCCKDKLVKFSTTHHQKTIAKFSIKSPCFSKQIINAPRFLYKGHYDPYASVAAVHLRPPQFAPGGVPIYILNSVFTI